MNLTRPLLTYLTLEALAVEADQEEDGFLAEYGCYIREHMDPFWGALPEETQRRLNTQSVDACQEDTLALVTELRAFADRLEKKAMEKDSKQ